jgi:hypothetical protein
LVAAGQRTELDRFVQSIETQMGRYISNREESIQADSGQFHQFEIRS